MFLSSLIATALF